MCSGGSNTPLRVLGFPIRISPDYWLVGTYPELFAASHVLHRFWSPRHPPLALSSLGFHTYKDARDRYEILKQRADGQGLVAGRAAPGAKTARGTYTFTTEDRTGIQAG